MGKWFKLRSEISCSLQRHVLQYPNKCEYTKEFVIKIPSATFEPSMKNCACRILQLCKSPIIGDANTAFIYSPACSGSLYLPNKELFETQKLLYQPGTFCTLYSRKWETVPDLWSITLTIKHMHPMKHMPLHTSANYFCDFTLQSAKTTLGWSKQEIKFCLLCFSRKGNHSDAPL